MCIRDRQWSEHIKENVWTEIVGEKIRKQACHLEDKMCIRDSASYEARE